MKRLFLLSFILLLFSNTAYSAQNENANINNSTEYTTIKKKDPKIFDKYIIKETDKTKYQQKISADNKKYSSIKNQLNNDQYNLYRIFEQIIRANNLEYQNWRIGIKRTATNVNASAGSANLILINSALYDSIYNDKDAVAFVLSHEMAHFLLNHTNKSAKIIYNIDKLEHKLKGLKYYAKSSSSKNELIYLSSISTVNIKLNRLYKKLREMELEADKEAISIMARAGYNPDNAVSVIEFFEKLPNIDTEKSPHPDNLERINNINKEISLIDKESLKNQGQANIFNSDVVSIKKSTDKYTFVMNAQKKLTLNTYVADSNETKLILKAYNYYLDDDMEQAELNFTEAFKLNKTNYAPALYLSYINEYNYLCSEDIKKLKRANYWIKKAKKLSPSDKNISKQEKDITSLLNKINK